MKQTNLFCLSGRTRFISQLSAFLLAFLFITSPLTPVFAQKAEETSTPIYDSNTATVYPIVNPAASENTERNSTPSIDITTTPSTAINNVTISGSTISDYTTTGTVPVDSVANKDPEHQQTKIGQDGITNNTASSVSSDNPANAASLSTSEPLIVKPDQSTGALVYSYPITIPQGRSGLTPELSLKYNSQRTDNSSIVGYGWEFSTPYITRKNTHGVDQLYNRGDYTSSEDGDLQLIYTSGSVQTFYPFSQNSDFSKYTLDTVTNTWKLTTKSGTEFVFGDSTASREDDPGNSSHVYKWMLSSISDTNSNTILYSYTKDQNKLYPSNIHYGIFDVVFINEFVSSPIENKSSGFTIITNKRVKEIDTKTNSQLSKSYVLNYSSNGINFRSLISAITETGYGSNGSTTLPPVTFSYTNNNNANGWNYTNNFSLPNDGSIKTDNSGGSVFIDVNGDGLTDILTSWDDSNGVQYRSAYLQNPNGGWTYSYAYQPSSFLPFTSYAPNLINNSVYFVDVNGDGLVDMLSSRIYIYQNGFTPIVFLNTGNGWAQSGYSIPVGLSYDGNPITTFADFNGDGLVDIFASSFSNGYGYYHPTQIFLNNGNGAWIDAIAAYNWGYPPVNSYGTQARFADVNGDGITDIILMSMQFNGQSCTDNKGAWVGDGKGGFVSNPAYVPQIYFGYLCPPFNPSDQNYGITYFDVNNDGLRDVMQHMDTYRSQSNVAFLNTGTGWQQNNNFNIPVNLSDGYTSTNAKLIDMNADGVTDIFSPYQSQYTNNSGREDLLSTITLPTGGKVDITYKSSAQYKDASGNLLNPKLPFVVQTVNIITTTDPVNNITDTNAYVYSGGSYFVNSYNIFDRKFAGFNKVIETDPVGNTTTTYYHQGNDTDAVHGEYNDDEWKIGKSYRVEIANSSGNLYYRTTNWWDDVDIGSGAKFVKIFQSLNSTYDGDSTHKDTGAQYFYDNTNGNLTQKTESGEVSGDDYGNFSDIGNDRFLTSYSYATAGTLSQISNQYTSDQNGNKIKESRYFYDNLPLGQLSLGNMTKQENWKSGSTYVNTQKSYNSYGLTTSSTNELGKVTNYNYDSYNLYPTSITNALNQTTNYAYNYSFGKVTSKTDPNGSIWTTSYDGLGRTIEEKIPDTSSGTSSVIKTTYSYTDIPNNTSIRKVDHLDNTINSSIFTYLDGLGRKIQERKEAEVGYSVKDYIYNNRGLLEKESLPYNSGGANKTTPTSDTTLYTSYTYDPLQRITSSTNAVGITTNTYSDWKTTITDAKNKQKIYYKDAYDNLVKVEENNAGNIYTTNYEWNSNKNLTKITDALSNIRNFTYDGLGRRLTAEDLHAPSDTTYGTWTYTYDDAGNTTQTVSPEAKTISYTYDALNRQLTENYTGATGTEITYAYDTCVKGIGRLCSSIVLDGGDNVYTYDSLGNVASDLATIDGNNYLTSYSYDRQNNLSVVTYPDNAQVKYTYNNAGLLEKIERKESGGTFTDVVSNFDYNPMGQVVTQADANSIITTNTYDSAKLYRLTNKKTINPAPLSPGKIPKPIIIRLGPPVTGGGGGKIPPETTQPANLQDLTYTYDNVGNITKIVDTSNTATVKTSDYVYDDLYRLTSAIITGVPASQTPYTQTYTYNAIGNITSASLSAGTSSTTTTYLYQGNTGTNYANPHAPTSVGGVTQTYDKDGNLTSSGDNTYSWNYKGKLSENLSSYNYYNAKGDRVWTNSFSSINSYYPNKLYSTACYNCYDRQPPNQRQTKLIKQIYAQDTSVMTTETLGTTVTPYYNHIDHLGSIAIVSDTNKNIAQTLDYYPYGKQRTVTPPGDYHSQRQYIGQVYDEVTGLDYLNARYYMAERGQFISQDPVFWEIGQSEDGKSVLLNPQSQNSYAYANGNPVINKDPSGRFIPVVIGLAYMYGPALIEAGLTAYFGYQIAQATGNAIGTAMSPATQEYKSAVYQSYIESAGALYSVYQGLPVGELEINSASKISDDALVVRGGSGITPEAFRIDTHPSGVKGFSVESGTGLDICALCKNIPNNQVRITTAGDIRAIGGDVISTSGKSSNHATTVNLSPQNANNVFSAPIKNPIPKQLRTK